MMEKVSRIRLGVNIDHVATLRNARGTFYPDPLKMVKILENLKVDGITQEIMNIALSKALVARKHILKEMNKVIDKARDGTKPSAPKILNIKISSFTIKIRCTYRITLKVHKLSMRHGRKNPNNE